MYLRRHHSHRPSHRTRRPGIDNHIRRCIADRDEDIIGDGNDGVLLDVGVDVDRVDDDGLLDDDLIISTAGRYTAATDLVVVVLFDAPLLEVAWRDCGT